MRRYALYRVPVLVFIVSVRKGEASDKNKHVFKVIVRNISVLNIDNYSNVSPEKRV